MEKYIFKYPAADDLSGFDEAYATAMENKRRAAKKFIALIGAALTAFALYCIPVFQKIDTLFLLMLVIIVLYLFFSARQFVNKSELNLLAITAGEEDMELTYYHGQSKKVLHIKYADIRSARFSDENYTSFQITFEPNEHSYLEEYDLKGNKLNVICNGLFLFNINEKSYEQYFFMYVADKLFTIEKFDRNKKFLRKYGSAGEYLKQLEDGE